MTTGLAKVPHLIFRLGLVPAVSIRILFQGDCHFVVEPDQENLKRMACILIIDHKTIGVQLKLHENILTCNEKIFVRLVTWRVCGKFYQTTLGIFYSYRASFYILRSNRKFTFFVGRLWKVISLAAI